MLYFCFRRDIGSLEKLAEKYFDRDDNAKIRTPEELARFHTWRTRQEMGGVRKGFSVSEHGWSSIPGPGADGYRTFVRVYEEALERMLEGNAADRAIESTKEEWDRRCKVIVGRLGDTVYIKTIPSRIPHDIPEAERKIIQKGLIPVRWPVSNSPFARLMKDLWEGCGINDDWDVYDEKGKERHDITYAIVGDEVPEPEGLQAVERVVFAPNVYDLMGIHDAGIVGRGAVMEIPPDGKVQEHDEDGNPVGEPYDPSEVGGEDMPFHLTGRPTVTDSRAATAKADEVAGMSGYVDLGGGYYAHPSGVHTGEATARACGVDLSRFEDSGRG